MMCSTKYLVVLIIFLNASSIYCKKINYESAVKKVAASFALLASSSVFASISADEIWDDESVVSRNNDSQKPVHAIGMHLLQMTSLLSGGERIGGKPVVEGEMPWQASILRRKGNFLYCGASIINQTWILTAAHCLTQLENKSRGKEEYVIHVGSVKYKSKGSFHNISTFISHPGFDDNQVNNLNDIALIKVDPPFRFNSNTKAVKLAESCTNITAGTIVTVAGWGDTVKDTSNVLLKVDMPIVDIDKCKAIYEKYGGLKSYQICAGLPDDGSDTCKGDSGGGLFYKGVQYGIISYGISCNEPGYPGVYTEVAEFHNWITYQMKHN